ncbi:terminase small subunit [Spirosoma utsteinense]|uniref:terminase small subunit n=1 Tax=Spirosoma utsteinense TaxID=2585773 RepID=UPI00164551D0|nr:terminase small subunit [Spirosoma utsteinense]MBC3785737.1 hypothetical protein [Spirosoma utsteinense]
METPVTNPLDSLKPNYRRFVEAYCECFNASESYRRAGYAKKNANVDGCKLLANPRIKAAIAYLCEQLAMSSGEAVKHMADIATTRLNDFMVIRMVLKTPMVRKGLQTLIDELDNEMSFEDEYATLAKLSDTELAAHKADQKSRELKGIRYALELERNPKAYRDVPGESVWVEEATVDLVALAKAKGQGRIKSLSYTEHGPKVELYAADSALDKILQLHGRYKQLPGDANQPKEMQGYVLPDGTTILF